MANQLIQQPTDLSTMSVEDLLTYGMTMESPDAIDIVSPRLKIPKEGGGNIRIGEAAYPSIEAIIVATTKARQLYLPDDSLSGVAPACSSTGAVYGNALASMEGERMERFQSNYPDHPYNLNGGQDHLCGQCPLSQYQVGGSICMQRQNLILMVEGYGIPVLGSLPRMSIKNFNIYTSGLLTAQVPYFSVWTKITPQTQRSSTNGSEYCVLSYERMDREVTQENLVRVLEWKRQAEESWSELSSKPEESGEVIPDRFTKTPPPPSNDVPF